MALIRRVCFYLFISIFMEMNGSNALAAESTELDQFSTYQLLSVQGHDMALQNKVYMPNGNWDSLLNSELDNKKNKKYLQSSQLSCSIPLQILKDFSLDKNAVATGSPPDAAVLYCDKDRIWFASRAYCGEGDDSNNVSGQGYLHAFDALTGKVTTYQNFIPRCESISSLERIEDEIWATTYFQGEYGTGGGSGILVLDLSTGVTKNAPQEVITHKFTDPSLSSIKYQRELGYVWVSTSSGIDRYSVKDHQWEQRYFDTNITTDNKLKLVLSPNQPSKKKLWLAYQLYFYPIDDLNGFANAWGEIDLYRDDGVMRYSIPVVHRSLLSYYISALKNMDDEWNDYDFISLLNVIGAHKDGDEEIVALLNQLLEKPMNSSRRSAVIQVANKFGLNNSHKLMDKQFESLLTDYFTNSALVGASERLSRMCQFAFNNKEYISNLNDYYLTHAISNEITEKYFLDDCVRAYSSWQGYSSLFPTVLKALNQKDDLQNLASLCSIFNHYANPDYRQPRFVFPIINARFKANKFKSNSKLLSACVPASYWIANSSGNIDELLKVIDAHPNLTSIAIDVLQKLTGKSLVSIQEWRNWWVISRKTFNPSRKKFYYGE
ncbi:MAG: hypothetical protein HOO95_01610 [Gallionella sp.]|nr:hypothetical protein [Gallionella sp.]